MASGVGLPSVSASAAVWAAASPAYLAVEFAAAEQHRHRAAPRTRRARGPRRNAHGAGHPYRNDVRSRLLKALLWLRIYPIYEVLGFFFDLHKRNAQLNVRAALEVLDALATFPFYRPGRDRTKLRSPTEVMAAFPQVRAIIDAREQRINRPKGFEVQEPYYSGKKI